MKKISNNSVVRLAKIYGELQDLINGGVVTINSESLAELTNLQATSIRRDIIECLSAGLGTQRVGFDTVKLFKAIHNFLTNQKVEEMYVAGNNIYFSYDTAASSGLPVQTMLTQLILSDENYKEFLENIR